MIKLAIAYRIYPKVSKETPIFNDDKLKLSEMCLSSFVKTLNVDYKFWALLDGCPKEYERLFQKYVPAERLTIIHTDSIGNAGTFSKQMDILLSQQFSENVYFAEDDYFYLNKPFEDFAKIIDSEKADFLTPYDHLDYYELGLHRYNQRISEINGIPLRQVSSTTMTFLTNKKNLSATKPIFETYLKKNYDVCLWLAITRLGIANPLTYLNSGLSIIHSLKIFVKIMLHTPTKFLFGKSYSLLAPKPSLALHLVADKLSPGIDWHSLFKKECEEIGI